MYRAYHAIRQLTGPDGRSTNAVYGFVTMLKKLIVDHRPEYIAAAFDVPAPTFRSEMAADYKANRAPMPPDLVEQVAYVHQACEALGVKVLTSAGFEADDLIGTLARQGVAAGFEIVVVTGDKDFFQLVDDHIRVFNPRDDGTWYDVAGVSEKFGVRPDQVVDVVALMGDSIDNIKGVPGIGEKGARELIATYGSLDQLLEQAATIPQKRYREALRANVDSAHQSRELARIHTSMDVSLDFESLRYQGASRERCFELFSKLGFRSILVDYAPTAGTIVKQYEIVRSIEDLGRLVAALEQAERFAMHVLGDSDSAMRAGLVGLSFSITPRQAWYIPLGHRTLEGTSSLNLQDVLDRLKPILEDERPRKVGHDLKFGTIMLARVGITLGGLAFDTMLASYVLDATRSTHLLEDLVLERLNYKALSAEDLRGKGARATSLADVPVDAIVDYAGERSDLALQLADVLEPAVEADGGTTLLQTLEMPLIPVLVEIERTGVRVDAPLLATQGERLQRELDALSARIYRLAGVEFNINSPRQLSDVLFERLQLPSTKRTGKTRSTSTAVDVLEELATVHELPREILDWRGLQKIKGTYVDALPTLIHPETGRVHTSFNQAVAATGRLSSSDPNLQNIPIRTELGREIRRAFVAEPGWLLISADYSQIELRVLAHLTRDEALIEAFRRGDDIHDQTALRVFGPESGLDRHELRRRAKIINYALLYGKTAFTLAKDIGVTKEAAQAFIDAYFAGFPKVRGFIDETIARARDTGVVSTMFGRKRKVPELTSRNGQIRAAAERVTVNLPIQGSAADIMKRAMLDVHRALHARPANEAQRARMILTVHDELVLETPDGDATETAALVKEKMEHAATLTVPLTVDVEVGTNWKDAKG